MEFQFDNGQNDKLIPIMTVRTPTGSDTTKVTSLDSAGEPAAGVRTQRPPLLPSLPLLSPQRTLGGLHGNPEVPHLLQREEKRGARAAPLVAGHLGLYRQNV